MPGHRTRVAVQAAGKRTSSVSNSLIAVLKDEIKYERESYRRDEALLSDPPGDFELQDVPGTSAFILGKRFGTEEIIIRVSIDEQHELDEDDEEEYEDEDEEALPVEFIVTVAKEDEDEVLAFECESDGEYLTIKRVALDKMSDEQIGMPYRGPIFENLDDTLQQAFVDYLEERGVTAYLGEYIRVYLQDKSSLEYQQWLGRMRDFIAR